MIRFIGRATLLALAVPFLGCQKVEPPPPAVPAKAEAKVKAGDLLDAFAKNSLQAEAKFKGKVIQVTGRVGSVQKTPLLGYDVQVIPEDAPDVNMSGVHCFITEAAKEEAAKLNPGDTVTMQGTCDGAPIGGQIKVSKCTVVK